MFDFDSGTDLAVRPEDRTPFSGGKRVLVDELLTRRQTTAIATVSYLAAVLIGSTIAVLRAPQVLWVGLAGIGLAYFYHAPPARLSYRGWGEAAVALCYGPLICAGTYLVQRQQLDAPAVYVSIPLGTHFQFRASPTEPVTAVAVTMPPWPGEDEAVFVTGPWPSQLG